MRILSNAEMKSIEFIDDVDPATYVVNIKGTEEREYEHFGTLDECKAKAFELIESGVDRTLIKIVLWHVSEKGYMIWKAKTYYYINEDGEIAIHESAAKSKTNIETNAIHGRNLLSVILLFMAGIIFIAGFVLGIVCAAVMGSGIILFSVWIGGLVLGLFILVFAEILNQQTIANKNNEQIIELLKDIKNNTKKK